MLVIVYFPCWNLLKTEIIPLFQKPQWAIHIFLIFNFLPYFKVNKFKIGLERPCEPTASDFKDGIVIAKCLNNMYEKFIIII